MFKKKTNKSKQDCIINDILNSHFIIGRNNKEKIKTDFISKLNFSKKEADELYNICAEIIVKSQNWVLLKNTLIGKIVVEIDTDIVLITYFSKKSLK